MGYFEKQGFSTEVSQPKERVGPALAALLMDTAEAALVWHSWLSLLHAPCPGHSPMQSQACKSMLDRASVRQVARQRFQLAYSSLGQP